ncbi:hypothetical protein [Halorhabdus sp. BNX81]|uniref:DUF7097 family protein n=1 Tax=Halorhabdus sp. BNX81 TaxID=2980181 RepID=UPI0023DD4CF2|nr:hypothetical protein [Halorhabdus sp. BNX81]WEL22175.1 Uncharacterized protein HBNXHr_2125 [Halorhabdus sp. BNX81]
MEKTDAGTTVGVEDPYAYVDRCDHCTDDGRCRFAVERGDVDPEFADELSARDFRCPVVGDPQESGLAGPWEWSDCRHMRARNRDRKCARCGLEERRSAHTEDRPLLEEHHLSYAGDGNQSANAQQNGPSEPVDADGLTHEITIYLCRWCHAKVHDSWASIEDPASPDPEAIAAREARRSREHAELGFESAAERVNEDSELSGR